MIPKPEICSDDLENGFQNPIQAHQQLSTYKKIKYVWNRSN
ncbi:hypothetical protein AQPE_0453 [Aquipluma nitroreducens]|uniref:Uncharacterized protein n=1 Tax=Aquipluma nitroreducens TaxID=2010828 RepID=A0A5K7S466_9BACT|nr:hypothetical protein AQPE_0453 [Aquipluma nitroreducens]